MRTIIEKIVKISDSIRVKIISRSFINLISRQNYAHNLTWCGVQIFQTPTDLFLYQQLIFRAKPNVIIETGVAKGGSVLFACQMLDILHGREFRDDWRVICSDINSLDEARQVINNFGYLENVCFFGGDSASLKFQNVVKDQLNNMNTPRVLLSLDSNHTEDHVVNELQSLARFVSLDSYAVIWDSRIGDLSRLTHYLRPRAWNRKHHAGTGVLLFIESDSFAHDFANCRDIENSLLLSGTKNGVLLRRQ